jgi:hypothetical protein
MVSLSIRYLGPEASANEGWTAYQSFCSYNAVCESQVLSNEVLGQIQGVLVDYKCLV